MRQFQSHGVEYAIDDLGVINQINPKEFTYDQQYVACYDGPEYRQQSDLLQALRLGFVIGAYGRIPFSVLDYGCGNGAFLKFAKQLVHDCAGHDVTGLKLEDIPVWSDVETVRRMSFDVITFWDVLEHLTDLSFLRTLSANLLVVSLPYCHYSTQGQEWFDVQYKHRKPNEHVRHFNPHSLKNLMRIYGWQAIATSNHEDVVRKSTHGLPNILSMAFKRQGAVLGG